MKRKMGVDHSFVLFTLRKLQSICVEDPDFSGVYLGPAFLHSFKHLMHSNICPRNIARYSSTSSGFLML